MNKSLSADVRLRTRKVSPSIQSGAPAVLVLVSMKNAPTQVSSPRSMSLKSADETGHDVPLSPNESETSTSEEQADGKKSQDTSFDALSP